MAAKYPSDGESAPASPVVPQTPASFNLRKLANSIHLPQSDRKSIRFVQRDESVDETDTEYDALTDICGKRWTLYRVSPLHRFAYSPIRLRQYGKKMREHLAVTKSNKKDKTVQYQAEFTVLPDLIRTPEDCKAIQVKASSSKNGEPARSHYTGLFMSWGSTRPKTRVKDSVNLPLLLCRGTLGLRDSVHTIMACFFDCVISRLFLTKEEIFWLSAMMAAICPTNQGSAMTSLIYTVPGLSIRGSLSLNIPQKSVVDIWKRIHDTKKDELLYSEILTLLNGLAEHGHCVYKVNLSMCRLQSAFTKDLKISQDGILKVYSTILADKVLMFICSVSEIIDSATPRSACPTNEVLS